MKRTVVIASLSAICIALGIFAGQFVCNSPYGHSFIGRCFGRGELVALVSGSGIYAADVEREAELDSYLAGAANDKQQSGAAILKRLIAEENLRHVSASVSISNEQVESDLDLLYAQFGDHKRWNEALSQSAISVRYLRAQMRQNLQALKWLEQQIASAPPVTEQECQQYSDAHQAEFSLPLRLRAAHLFLAAPVGTSTPVTETKRAAIDALSNRIAQGEEFSRLMAEASEDEATKMHSGDLNYFAATRMPPEFFAATEKTGMGEIGRPFQSHLGFHIVTVTDVKLPRQMSFAEARPEIRTRLNNERRVAEVATLREKMFRAEYLQM